jgi:hypothetical protein
MQQAFGETIRDLGQIDSALGLGSKADECKSPLLHQLTAEAILKVGKSGTALSEVHAERLMYHLQIIWNTADPWHTRLRLAKLLAGVKMNSQQTWETLATLLQEALAAGASSGWNSSEIQRIQEVQRECLQNAQPAS